METYWQQLIGSIVAPTVVVGAIAWLMRGYIEKGFEKDIHQFKSTLEREAYEHKERFSLIHQRRADVIATLYSKMARSKSVVANLVATFQQGGQSLIEKSRRTADVYNDMASYFFENRIFLPRKTAEKAEMYIMTLRDVLIDFDTAQMGNDEYKADPTGLWIQAFNNFRDEIPPIMDELEREFKEILGFIEKRL